MGAFALYKTFCYNQDMSAPAYNPTWPQGEDLRIQLKYKEGGSPETAETIDLSTGYQLRMDIVKQSTQERVYTFNSDPIDDVDSSVEGDQPDTTTESALSSGAGDTPNIVISVPRSLTLPGGSVYSSGGSIFEYDVFLRNTANNTQVKILTGTITIEPSRTLWA